MIFYSLYGVILYKQWLILIELESLESHEPSFVS